MVQLRLFGPAAEAAGTRSDSFDESTVAEILRRAGDRYGPEFELLLPHCKIWVNGEPADSQTVVKPADEVAVLPPVSGG